MSAPTTALTPPVEEEREFQHGARQKLIGRHMMGRQGSAPNSTTARFGWYFCPEWADRIQSAMAPVPLPAAQQMIEPRPLLIHTVDAARHAGVYELRMRSFGAESSESTVIFRSHITVTHGSKIYVLRGDEPLVLRDPAVDQWLHLLNPISPERFQRYYVEELQPLCRAMLAEAHEQLLEFWLSTRANEAREAGLDPERETRRCAALIGLRRPADQLVRWIDRTTGRDAPMGRNAHALPPFPATFTQYLDAVGLDVWPSQWVRMFLDSRLLGPMGGGLTLHRASGINGWLRIERQDEKDVRSGLYFAYNEHDLDDTAQDIAASAAGSPAGSPLPLSTVVPLAAAAAIPIRSVGGVVLGPLMHGRGCIEVVVFNPQESKTQSNRANNDMAVRVVKAGADPETGVWSMDGAVPFNVAFLKVRESDGVVRPARFSLDSAPYPMDPNDASVQREWFVMPVHHTAPSQLQTEEQWMATLAQDIMEACAKRSSEFLVVPIMRGTRLTQRNASDIVPHLFGTALPRAGSRTVFALFAFDDAPLLDDGPPPLPRTLAQMLADERAQSIFDNDPDNDNDMDCEVWMANTKPAKQAPLPISCHNRRLAAVCALAFTAVQSLDPMIEPTLSTFLQPNTPLYDPDAARNQALIVPQSTLMQAPDAQLDWYVETATAELTGRGPGPVQCGTLGSLVMRCLASRANCATMLREYAVRQSLKTAFDSIAALINMTAAQLRLGVGLHRIAWTRDGVALLGGAELVLAPTELEGVPLYEYWDNDQCALSTDQQLQDWMRQCLNPLGHAPPSTLYTTNSTTIRERIRHLGLPLLWRLNAMAAIERREMLSPATERAVDDCDRNPLPLGKLFVKNRRTLLTTVAVGAPIPPTPRAMLMLSERDGPLFMAQILARRPASFLDYDVAAPTSRGSRYGRTSRMYQWAQTRWATNMGYQQWWTKRPVPSGRGWSGIETQDSPWSMMAQNALPTFTSLLDAATDLDARQYPGLDQEAARRLSTTDRPALLAHAVALDRLMLALRDRQWARALFAFNQLETDQDRRLIDEFYSTLDDTEALSTPATRAYTNGSAQVGRGILAQIVRHMAGVLTMPTDLLQLGTWLTECRTAIATATADRRAALVTKIDTSKSMSVQDAIDEDRLRELRALLDPIARAFRNRADMAFTQWLVGTRTPPSNGPERLTTTLNTMRQELLKWAEDPALQEQMAQDRALWPAGLMPTRDQLMQWLDQRARLEIAALLAKYPPDAAVALSAIPSASGAASGAKSVGPPLPSPPVDQDDRPMPDDVQAILKAFPPLAAHTPLTYADVRDLVYGILFGTPPLPSTDPHAQIPYLLALIMAPDWAYAAGSTDAPAVLKVEMARMIYDALTGTGGDYLDMELSRLAIVGEQLKPLKIAENFRHVLYCTIYYSQLAIQRTVVDYVAQLDPVATNDAESAEGDFFDFGLTHPLRSISDALTTQLIANAPAKPNIWILRNQLFDELPSRQVALAEQWGMLRQYRETMGILLDQFIVAAAPLTPAMAVPANRFAPALAIQNPEMRELTRQQTLFFRPDSRESGLLSAALNTYFGAESDEAHRRRTALPMSVWAARIDQLNRSALAEPPVSTGHEGLSMSSAVGSWSAIEKRDLLLRSLQSEDVAQCAIRMALRHYEESGPATASVVPLGLMERLLWALISDSDFLRVRQTYGLMLFQSSAPSLFHKMEPYWYALQGSVNPTHAYRYHVPGQDHGAASDLDVERDYWVMSTSRTRTIFLQLREHYPSTVKRLDDLLDKRHPEIGYSSEWWRLVFFGREHRPSVLVRRHDHHKRATGYRDSGAADLDFDPIIAHQMPIHENQMQLYAEMVAFLVDFDAAIDAAIIRCDQMVPAVDASRLRQLAQEKQRIERDAAQLLVDQQTLELDIRENRVGLDRGERELDLLRRSALLDRDYARLDADTLRTKAKPSDLLKTVDRVSLMHSVFVFLLGYLVPSDPLDALFVQRLHPDGHVLYDYFRGDIPLFVGRQIYGLQMARRQIDVRWREAFVRLMSGRFYGPIGDVMALVFPDQVGTPAVVAVPPPSTTTLAAAAALPPTTPWYDRVRWLYEQVIERHVWMGQHRVLMRFEREDFEGPYMQDPLDDQGDLSNGRALCFVDANLTVLPAGPGLPDYYSGRRKLNVSPLFQINTGQDAADGSFGTQGGTPAFELESQYSFYEWRVGQQYYLRPSKARNNAIRMETFVAPVGAHNASTPQELPALYGRNRWLSLEFMPERSPVLEFFERLFDACEPGHERPVLIDQIEAAVIAVANSASARVTVPPATGTLLAWRAADDGEAVFPNQPRVEQRDAQYRSLQATEAASREAARQARAQAYSYWFEVNPLMPPIPGQSDTDRLLNSIDPIHPEQSLERAQEYVAATARGSAAYERYLIRIEEKITFNLNELQSQMGF